MRDTELDAGEGALEMEGGIELGLGCSGHPGTQASQSHEKKAMISGEEGEKSRADLPREAKMRGLWGEGLRLSPTPDVPPQSRDLEIFHFHILEGCPVNCV